jgi:hypothetical protein
MIAYTAARPPLPRVAAAYLALGRLTAELMPWWAARWLADGHDGAALRELAGLDGSDLELVRGLLPAAFTETSTVLPDRFEAVTAVFTDIARHFLNGDVSAHHLVLVVERLYIAEIFADNEIDLPLCATCGFDDEWTSDWGRTTSELTANVRDACLKQLAHEAASS